VPGPPPSTPPLGQNRGEERALAYPGHMGRLARFTLKDQGFADSVDSLSTLEVCIPTWYA